MHVVCIMFACSQAHPARGLFGWSEPQRARHGPQVDVVKLAATPWPPVLAALSIFEELAFAVPHSSRDGSVVSSRDERQPAQNRRNRHNVDLWIRLRLIQQLSSDLACLAPPRGDSPVQQG